VDVKRTFQDSRARPDAIHQVIFGDQLARRPGEDFNDLERTPTKGRGDAVNPKLPVA